MSRGPGGRFTSPRSLPVVPADPGAPSRAAEEAERLAGRGLEAAGYFLLERVQELISVQAPTRTTRSGRLVATTRAIPGAPPRVVSGQLRGSGFVRKVRDREVHVVLATDYAASLELEMDHPYMIVALNEHLSELGRIVADEMVGEVRAG